MASQPSLAIRRAIPVDEIEIGSRADPLSPRPGRLYSSASHARASFSAAAVEAGPARKQAFQSAPCFSSAGLTKRVVPFLSTVCALKLTLAAMAMNVVSCRFSCPLRL